ncbi:lipoyl(octanoyl) transferase LipB [Dichotomicrobium thermohalophilum]|uniref:Octanoyltransferase n=1 Tax=Dichotomicrobium thermohalophilum TaxID=933063 RepID=A0A397Q8G8_9HYPH|nr:lipoyl(octanoyl) transferase LipB [Dichotomicrobium thermohalophilum]RIA55827.1 lipoyl(octanoyl) transferase [Dichotomicrobium thermohalophilum]
MTDATRHAQKAPVGWAVSAAAVAYPDAMAAMDDRVRAIRDGRAGELVWLLEHPPLYTAGTSAKADDLLAPDRFPVYQTGRGGQYTYHGPGQRVAYVMLDLARRKQDVRWFVSSLEEWLITTLAEFGVHGARRNGQAGVWVSTGNGLDGAQAKIAALGVRLRRWVSFHGISLNVAPDLTHFSGIVPCGVTDAGVTSLAALGVKAELQDVDRALRATFERQFGCVTADAPAPLTAPPEPLSRPRPSP